MLKVLELFSGTGCQVQALKNIGIECVSTQCEIDKYAVNTYNQLHGETPNLGDISKVKVEDLKEGQFDLITYSSPCQDFSVAGLGRGGDKGSGTRSSLLFECEKIIRKVRPKYLLFENVKNLLSEKHVHNFMEWLKILEEMGYCSYYDVLNAKDFGIPQNRERIFCVSILGKHVPYVFPQKQPLKLRLKDMLEDRPDEKYYIKKEISDKFKFNLKNKEISNSIRVGGKDSTDQKHSWNLVADKDNTEIQQIGNLYNSKNRDNPQRGRVYSTEGIATACNTCQGGGLQAHIIEPLICASRGRYNEQGTTEQQLEINKENTTNTITTVSKDNLVIEPINTEPDGTAKTIKAQYAKTRAANFIRNGTFGATGVKEVPKIERIGGMYGQATRWGVYSDEGISPTITASMGLDGGHIPMVEEKQERLSKQAYETLEENKCKDGDIINPFNKKVVDDGICPTITTRPEGFKTANLVVVDDRQCKLFDMEETVTEKEIKVDDSVKPSVAENIKREKEQIINSKQGDYNNAKNERIYSLLSILWEEIRKEEIQKGLRKFFSFQEKKILQSGMYEKGIFENRGYSYKKQYILQTYSSISRFFNIETKILSNLWEKLKFRCASQGSQSTKQYIREFGGIMQELSYEDTQTKEKMYNLWQTNERFELLRKTLSEIQKIWQSVNDKQRTWTHSFRIRKLTERECWRLQGWKDEQFDKIKGISRSQLYKMAGNGIVINVLEAIFTNMFLRKPTKEEEKFVVDKPLVQLDLF